MATTESGFGPKLQRAKNLVNILGTFQNYTPPRPQESLAAMQQLLSELDQLNTDEAAQRENYRSAVDIRQKAFGKSPGSVDKLLSPIYSAVSAQFGKEQKQTLLVAEIIRKMRGTKPGKKSVNPAPAATKSTYEQSFASLEKFFSDLVTTLAQYGDYDPSNPALSTATLQQKVQELAQYTEQVVSSEQALRMTRINRAGRYEELQARAGRIKLYVKAQYGNNSPEHLSVRSTKA